MNIHELKQHEVGILNLYEQNTGYKIKHNKTDNGMNIFDIRLSAGEYDSIFDNPPTFQEKKAFVEVFRKKWKEDKGYCSVFDKRSIYKAAKNSNIKPSLEYGVFKRPRTSMSTKHGKKSSVYSNKNQS